MFPKYLDTHTHLNHPMYADEWERVAARALLAGTWMIVVGSDYPSSVRAVEIAESFPYGVYAAVGVHPLVFEREEKRDVTTIDQFVDVEAFRELATHPKVVALGEVGLDFHDLRIAHQEDELHREFILHLQYQALLRFLELSREFRLPLILHVRDAHDEMIRVLYEFDRKSKGFDSRGVVHHFTGDWKQAVRYLNADFLPSFTGLIARSHTRQEVIQKIPLTKLVIESECPMLVPQPVGMGRPGPEYLPSVIGQIAALKGASPDEVARVTTQNALRMFSRILRSLPA